MRVVTTISLDPQTRDLLKNLAAREDRNQSQVIRRMIRQAAEQKGMVNAGIQEEAEPDPTGLPAWAGRTAQGKDHEEQGPPDETGGTGKE